MLILSSYTDYYDRVATSGIDITIRYHRQTTILKAPSPFHIDHLPRNLMGGYFDYISFQSRHRHDRQDALNALSCDFQIIGFCGTYLVAVCVGKKYYMGEDILDLDWSTKKRHQRSTIRQIVADCIQKFHNKTNHSLFQEFKVPVFVVPIIEVTNLDKQRHRNQEEIVPFTLNPNLKDLDFHKYKDSYSTFQDIQSYLSGILGIEQHPTLELSDRSKILKAGFDPKTSFRKGKPL